jgi:predicted DNA-binding transcriptional regulator YafY
MIRVERLLRLIHLLHTTKPCSVATLCDELDVSRRTLFRDLNILKDAGLTLSFDKATQSYVPGRHSLLPPLMLDVEEALALMFQSTKALAPGVTPEHQAVLRAAAKIEAALPPQVVDRCGEMLEGVDVRYWPVSDLESIQEVLGQLQQALADRRKVAVTYDSYFEGREIDTVLHLYRLRFMRRGWYAIAFSEMHAEVRTFKIERMITVEVLQDEYAIDELFNLRDYYRNAWQMIRGDQSHYIVIHFSPKVAGNVEEVAWHKTQQLRRKADGTLVFEVRVDGLSEIVWWILGYGKEAVVQRPPELRQMVAEHARAMAGYYAADDSPEARETS